MGKYVPQIQFSARWDDDDVAATLEPMTREDFTELANSKAVGEVSIMAAIDSILNRRLLTLVGIRDANGNAVSKEEVLKRVFFVGLVSEIFAALKEGSILGKETSPGSEPKLPDGSGAQT